MLNQVRTRLRGWSDSFLGRGTAAITLPIMDGVLKPNRVLDEASVVLQLPGLDDVASNGHLLWFSAGQSIYNLIGSQAVEAQRFERPVTAIAVQAGRIAVALGGSVVQLLCMHSDARWTLEATLEQLDGQALHGVNALAFDSDGSVLLSDGSNRQDPAHWCHDLMELGHSGRVARWNPARNEATTLADGLHYAFGVLAQESGVLISESWRHRVSRVQSGVKVATTYLSDELVGYPSRMATASNGGFWVSCFACRTQLVEFILREPEYRQRMIKEVDPRYWIAPALSSGHSFLEPLQGAGVKQMGLLKPWAPPRSYGLVLRMSPEGRVLASLHSQVGGVHHGITAVTECDGALYVVSKGSARLLRIPLEASGAIT